MSPCATATVVIVREGKSRKFVRAVEQITFNGGYAAETGQPVLYVTERCVFRRTAQGMVLDEVAPGIDIERDILAHMDFVPIIDAPRPMDARIFRDEPMQLEDTLLGLGLAQRISYDPSRNTVFLNLEGMHVRTRDDVDRVRRVVEDLCQQVGKKVALVVNYDNFEIDPAVADTYAAMIRYMETHYYTTASRYTTSAFLRLKLGEALSRRRVAPHIFETADEAHAFVRDDPMAPPLDPQVAAVLEKIRLAGNPEYWQMTPAQARDWHNRKAGILDIRPSRCTRWRTASCRASRPPCRCASTRPRASQSPLPVLVWLHGGGHVVGQPAELRRALSQARAVRPTASWCPSTYRLAPEHKFPAGVSTASRHSNGRPTRGEIGGDARASRSAATAPAESRRRCARSSRATRASRARLPAPRVSADGPDEDSPSHHALAKATCSRARSSSGSTITTVRAIPIATTSATRR
jgi:hypothetical protein